MISISKASSSRVVSKATRCLITSYNKQSFHVTTKRFSQSPPSKASNASSSTPKPSAKQPSTATYNSKDLDPHQVASEMVRNSSDGRISGIEALEAITPEQKMRNFGTAFGLAGFCIGVWYYTIQSVGKADDGIDKLIAEAEEARANHEKKSLSDKKAEELAQLDVTMSQLSKDVEGAEDLTFAVAAPDEIAQLEEDLNSAAGNNKGTSANKPLWKKIVFFWRKN
jgi:hypothetical protein